MPRKHVAGSLSLHWRLRIATFTSGLASLFAEARARSMAFWTIWILVSRSGVC